MTHKKSPTRSQSVEQKNGNGFISAAELKRAKARTAAAAEARRAEARAEAVKARAEEQAAEEADRIIEEAREFNWWQCKRRMKKLCCAVAAALVVVLAMYFSVGCGACENGSTCDGMLGGCVCAGDQIGGYCEDSCGDFGESDGESCVCSDDWIGRLCDAKPLDARLGMIMRSDYNEALVQAVTYTGPPATLSWSLQHHICATAGRATPGSDASTCTSCSAEGIAELQDGECAYSESDNYVVTGQCTTTHTTSEGRSYPQAPPYGECHGHGWQGHGAPQFTHVSGSLPEGRVGYMCASWRCEFRVRVEAAFRGRSEDDADDSWDDSWDDSSGSGSWDAASPTIAVWSCAHSQDACRADQQFCPGCEHVDADTGGSLVTLYSGDAVFCSAEPASAIDQNPVVEEPPDEGYPCPAAPHGWPLYIVGWAFYIFGWCVISLIPCALCIIVLDACGQL
eukprot:COSAG04_NODE_460_length_13977_cov_5.936662_5_plen_453_part_00